MAPQSELPPGFVVDELPPGFTIDDQDIAPPSALDKFTGRIAENVQAVPSGLKELALTPVHTMLNLPSSFKKVTESWPGAGFNPAVAGPLIIGNAFLDAATRNAPQSEKGVAKRNLLSSIGGGALGGAVTGAYTGNPFAVGLGALAGGVAAPFATNQIEQQVGSATDTPIKDDLINASADFVSGVPLIPIQRMGSYLGKKYITSPMARKGVEVSDTVEALTDPDRLRAAGLSTNPTEQFIRAPRKVFIPENIRKAFADRSKPEVEVDSGAVTQLEAQRALPDTDATLPVPTDKDLGIVGSGTSGEVNTDTFGSSSKLQSERGNKRYSLQEATSEVPEFFEFQRDPSKSEFLQVAENIDNITSGYNQTVDGILSNLPPEANRPVKAALFSNILKKVNDDTTPYGMEKPFRDVLMSELEKFASKQLQNPSDIQEFRNLLRRYRTYDSGGSNPLDDAEMLRLNDLMEKVGDAPISPMDLRAMKTQYDKLGKWDMSSAGGSSDAQANAMRKDAYREMANSIRGTLEDVVAEHAPDQLQSYSTANRKMYLGAKMLPLAEKRLWQEAAQTRQFRDTPMIPRSKPTFPVIGSLANWLTDKMAPQISSPQARMYAADPNPGNFGTGYSMASPLKLTGYAAEGMEQAGKAGTTALNALDANPAIGGAGAAAAVSQNPNEQKPAGFFEGSVLPALKKIGAAIVPEAKAEVSQATALLPRDTEGMTPDALESFMLQTAQLPQAPIAQGLVKKLQSAMQAQDMDTIEKIHSDMARLFPDLFEPGVGVNGKIFYPDEQLKYMSTLKQLHRMGQVDSIHLAKQRNAFNNPQDGRMLPLKPAATSARSGRPRFYEGTRVYDY